MSTAKVELPSIDIPGRVTDCISRLQVPAQAPASQNNLVSSPVRSINSGNGNGGYMSNKQTSAVHRKSVSRRNSGKNSKENLNDTIQSTNNSQVLRPKCCLFWCCCCRCNCLTSKSHEHLSSKLKDQTNSDLSIGDADLLPSLEEIRMWADSFDRLMKNRYGRNVFREFLKCEYSEENILFWLACEDLKKETNPEKVEEKARIIYEDYISILSPKEVSLDSRVREVVNRNMMNPNKHTFDEAQLQIYTLMHRDSYPRFINSHQYKKLSQSYTGSRKESTT
ncbi:regulator of G-protein signaling 17-like [Artemia franciscana]|uniref:regulator of G-protein signaling 17-like n=1 Tax=Artemia franciscana TaxID=6661 RepID=UPI0032D9B372